MLVHHDTLIQYFKDQNILKGLGNKQKNIFKHPVMPTIEVEVPSVTGCRVDNLFNIDVHVLVRQKLLLMIVATCDGGTLGSAQSKSHKAAGTRDAESWRS